MKCIIVNIISVYFARLVESHDGKEADEQADDDDGEDDESNA